MSQLTSSKVLNFKEIHIGALIKKCVIENGMDETRICNFMKCTDDDILKMYNETSLDSEVLLKWSKLLSYDFFRIYSQHLIFYSPPFKNATTKEAKTSLLPNFRKNLYTQEIIDFIMEQLDSGQLTKTQVIERYNIPKTTLYKWISKYKN